jgi:lipoate-protein ligase A
VAAERGGIIVKLAELRCLVHGPASGAWNMAVDEVLMDSARAGRATLRFYRWEPGCLSFGRNQTARGRYDADEAARRGIDVVRRPTGGRSVFHHRELTYSVTAPAAAWGNLRQTYVLINRVLAAGLAEMGAAVGLAGRSGASESPRPTVRTCFRDPLPGEVTAAGRKLVGSAQWRERGSLLQHGSLLLHSDQAVVEELRIGDSARDTVPAIGLAEILDPLPHPDVLARKLSATFGAALGVPVRYDELENRERASADRLRSRYEDAAWTWRR